MERSTPLETEVMDAPTRRADPMDLIDTLAYEASCTIVSSGRWDRAQSERSLDALHILFRDASHAIANHPGSGAYVLGLRRTGDNYSLIGPASEFVNNAYDATVKYQQGHPGHDGRMRLSLHIADGRLRFDVLDSAGGVPSSVAPKLFKEPVCDGFYENSAKKNVQEAEGIEGGCGLGLYIARSVIEGLGGTCGFENTSDRTGARFFYDVPLCNVVKAYARKQQSASRAA